jgi:hypothetical protein
MVKEFASSRGSLSSTDENAGGVLVRQEELAKALMY